MILIIDNYDSFTYNLYQIFATLVDEVKVVRNDQFELHDVHTMAPEAIILSPGPGRPENAGLCIPLIQRYYKDYPILGICLGLQSIVASFAGVITRAPRLVHGKPCAITHHKRGLYVDLPSPMQVGRYHSLIADRKYLPEVFAVDAQTSDGMIMGITHRQAPCFGMQFHPESILTNHGMQLAKNFMNIIKVR